MDGKIPVFAVNTEPNIDRGPGRGESRVRTPGLIRSFFRYERNGTSRDDQPTFDKERQMNWPTTHTVSVPPIIRDGSFVKTNGRARGAWLIKIGLRGSNHSTSFLAGPVSPHGKCNISKPLLACNLLNRLFALIGGPLQPHLNNVLESGSPTQCY